MRSVKAIGEIRCSAILIGWIAAVIFGCGENTGPQDGSQLEQRGNVQVSFSTQAPPGVAPVPRFSPVRTLGEDTLSSGPDTLILTSVEIVLRKIEIKPQETSDCDVLPDGCEEVEVGPVLIDLPLGPGADSIFVIEVPSGTYERIDFEVHKVSSGDPDDAAFLQGHPDFDGKSIRVRGRFNEQAYTFESDLDVEQELDLVPPMVIGGAGAETNVTIRMGVDAWFRSATGALVDPATANKGGVNESTVKESIKQSVKAFEDPDEDGIEGD